MALLTDCFMHTVIVLFKGTTVSGFVFVWSNSNCFCVSNLIFVANVTSNPD